MKNVFNYIKSNWLLLSIGCGFFVWFVYLTYSGNQWCDCVKTEKIQDGQRTNTHTRSFYRFYHK
ncbi:hypothetical protein G6R40_11275 [Chryseobacterium sp. POL2]|uniref:hypothetical protein n=1 Tax=Chryseobacterium sp. POL2 TaxID=2713414 RepID=UPI0013E12603|nr:hypothetical protein [Chryseobacterium sp. POL2]QIG90209.1 hypothetical protein G6R40_11275 [Chryseobacterium sp. POL2]